MTYQEIQDRLSKCESTLEQLKKGSAKPTEKITVKNLELLKESLEKQLVEADKGVVYTDDEKIAKDLADGGTNVKLTSEMKPGDDEDIKQRKLSRLTTSDKLKLMAAQIDLENEKQAYKKKNEASDGPSIDKMSRAQCIDFLNTSPEKVNHMSDEELRDACKDKNADLRENLDNSIVFPDIPSTVFNKLASQIKDPQTFASALLAFTSKVSEKENQAMFKNPELKRAMELLKQLSGDKQIQTNTEKGLSEAIDPSITDLLVQFVSLMGMGYGAYAAAKKLSNKHGDIDLDSIKAALSKKEDKEKDDYGRNHYPEKGEYTKLSDEEREAMKNNKLGIKEDEDIDVGHQDDEPDMLKSSAMETATYAAKLYKKLHKYDNFDGEVDFPHWWQKKLILARDYLSAAFHYLDSEEKQPIIDKLALENVNENEIGDADKDIGKGYKNARLVIAYIRDNFYRGMNDEELDEFNDEMIFHFKQEVDAIKSFKSPVNRGVTEEEDIPVPDVPVDDIQFMHDQIVNRMKELAKIYKEKGKDATVMLGVNKFNMKQHNVVDVLKKLTKKKRELEDALQNKVAGIGQDQELDEIAFKDIPCPACGDPECDHKEDHL